MRKTVDSRQETEDRRQKRVGSEQGVALILTLAILTLVTLLVISFAVSMRVENTASKNFNDLIRARQLAQAAVDQAVATIRDATPPASTTRAWVAAPGAIISTTGGGIFTTNALYTDEVVLGTGKTNLNDNLLVTGSNDYYYAFANAAITAGWQNVTTTIGGGTELVGRFAYWTDVESAKVDINQAGIRTASNPTITADPLMNQSMPSDIDLRALEPPFYDNPSMIGDSSTPGTFMYSHSDPAATPPRPWFSTVEEMRRGLTPPPATYGSFTSNRFFVTVGTVDTNTDAFGRDRIDLTQITSDSASAFTAAQNSFQDTAWGSVLYSGIVLPARDTLQEKYGTFGMNQLLANIAEYQLPYNAALPVVGVLSAGLDGDFIPQSYAALRKGPLIDAVIVHVATNIVDVGGGVTNLVVHAFVDVKLVNGYDTDRSGWVLKILPSAIGADYINGASGAGNQAFTVSESTYTLGNVPAHSFRLLGAPAASTLYVTPSPSFADFNATILGAPGAGAPVATNVTVVLQKVRLLTQDNDNNVVDWLAPIDFSTQVGPSGMKFHNGGVGDIVPYLAGSSPQFNSSSANTDFMPIMLGKQDPRTRTFTGLTAGQIANSGPILSTNWFVYPSGGHQANAIGDHSFTSRITPENYGLLADSRSIEPGSGTVAPTHTYLIDQISELPFVNLGELSYIHSGYPWRTIRLRSVYPETSTGAAPFSYGDRQLGSPYNSIGDPNTDLETIELNALADWVVLDMFKVGNAATFPGRININMRFSGPAGALFPRVPPLAAIVNATSVFNQLAYLDLPLGPPFNDGPGTNVDVIASRIANRILVSNVVSVTPSPYVALPAYFTPGEICEAEGLGYFSDTTTFGVTYDNNPSKTRRQQLIRRISNLVTTRSNLFTIWATAQSVRDVDRDGLYNSPPDFETGEVKVQAIVERYEDPPGTVKFRTRYYRYIYE